MPKIFPNYWTRALDYLRQDLIRREWTWKLTAHALCYHCDIDSWQLALHGISEIRHVDSLFGVLDRNGSKSKVKKKKF